MTHSSRSKAIRWAERAAIALALTIASACDPSITTPVGTPVAIAWSPCVGSSDLPDWFAVQNGTTAWTQVTPLSGVFNFTLTAGRGGVAYRIGSTLNVFFGTTDEIKDLAPSCAGATRIVTGALTGYTVNDYNAVFMGGSATSVVSGTPTPADFALDEVDGNAAELIAVKGQTTASASFLQTAASSVFIRRSITTNSVGTIDLNSSSESGPTTLRLATIAGATTAEQISVTADVATATSRARLSSYVTTLGTVAGTITASFAGIPGTRLIAGELQGIEASASRQVTTNTIDRRYAATTFVDAGDRSVTLGASITPPAISGTSRPSAVYTIQTGYDKVWDFTLDQASVSIDMIMTSGYLGSTATSVTMRIPDLSAAKGFDAAWLIGPGTVTAWSFYASGGGPQTLNGKLGTFQAAVRESSFTP